MLGKGNQSTQRKTAPVPFCPPQIPHDLPQAWTRTAKVGTQWLTAWATAQPIGYLDPQLKPFWVYRIQFWGMAFTSNIEIPECFQSKSLRTIVDTPWFMPNMVVQRDLQTLTVKEEICHYTFQYSAHPNNLIVNLMAQPDNNRWLWRHLPNELSNKCLVQLSYL
jgi:hypothetical protein